MRTWVGTGATIARTPVTIGRLEPAHTDAVSRLWAETFPPVEPYSDGIEAAADPKKPSWTGYVAVDRGELAGFGLLRYTEDALDLFDLEADQLASTDQVDAAFYLTCVAPQYRHGGLGTELGERRIEAARERGGDRVVGISWEAGARIYERCGFDRVATVQDYYDHEPGGISVWRRDL